MQNHAQNFLQHLQKFANKENVLFEDYRALTVNTKIDFRKIRGNIGLMKRKVRTDKEVMERFDKLADKLPV